MGRECWKCGEWIEIEHAPYCIYCGAKLQGMCDECDFFHGSICGIRWFTDNHCYGDAGMTCRDFEPSRMRWYEWILLMVIVTGIVIFVWSLIGGR